MKIKLFVKYTLDKIVAFVLLLLALPVIVFLAILIKLDGWLHPENAGPVFHTEPRISQGKEFKIIKFRTVTKKAYDEIHRNPYDSTISGHPDRSWAGKFILRWYLDELPQLFCILKGDMSFVGPRPQPPKVYQKMIVRGIHALTILKGGLLGIPQACKRFRSFRRIFADMAKEYRIEHKRWRALDLLYLRKVEEKGFLGLLAFDFYIFVKGLQTVFAGESHSKK